VILTVVGWRKDAEGAGRWVIQHIRTKKGRTEITDKTIAIISKWAFH